MKDVGGAARKIRDGGLVAFPTETVYGLGANALDEKAVKKIYAAKGRPTDNPCIVHVADEAMLRVVATDIPDKAKRLMDLFWPGPLTLVLKKADIVPDVVTGGLPTVAVRMPSHPVALELVKRADVPIAAPSANKSGRPSPTTADHVRDDFPNLTVLDAGSTEKGIESTVVAFNPDRILRQGAIPLETLRKHLSDITVAKPGAKTESPGMKYKHYAPSKPLLLFTRLGKMQKYAKEHPKAVVLCPDEHVHDFPGSAMMPLGEKPEQIAHNLFTAIRAAEEAEEILVLAIEKLGVGRAVMDRLERAATKVI